MQLDPTITAGEIAAILKQQSGLVYGDERTSELDATIDSIAAAMAELASRELDLRAAAPAIGSPDGSDQS